LYQQSRFGSCNPEYGDIVNLCTQSLKNPAYVAILKGEAELDAQEAKAHVPNLPA
jgi:hypothetical protein